MYHSFSDPVNFWYVSITCQDCFAPWRLSEEHQCRWLWKADDYSFTSIPILGIQTSPAWIAMIAPLVLALFSVANSHNASSNPDEDHHNSHLPEDNIYHVTSCLRTFNILLFHKRGSLNSEIWYLWNKTIVWTTS